MKNIPQDIDRTLWAIAESNDARAVEEFGERYPAYKAELVTRIAMVRTLRSQRPSREAPYLTLPQYRQQPRLGRGLGLAFAGIAMVSLAFALIAKPWAGPSNLTSRQNAGGQSVVGKSDPVQKDSSGPGMLVRPSDGQNGSVETKSNSVEEPSSPLDRLVQIDRDRVKLSQVVREIGQQAKLKIEVAPGMEDQVVSAKYQGVTAVQALTDLGQNFGFTVLPQEENHVLIVPAIDPNKPPITLPGGSFSEPSDNLRPGHQAVQAPDGEKHQ